MEREPSPGQQQQQVVGQVIKEATEVQLNRSEEEGINEVDEVPMRIYISDQEVYYVDFNAEYWDEVSNKKLNREEVILAGLNEVKQVQNHGVYEKVPTQQCWDRTGKAPILVRWIDINKGGEVNREYRSRLEAKEIKTDKREDLFAATAPPERRNFSSA